MKPKPPKTELEKLYLEDKLSYKELGGIFSVNSSTIGDWLKSYNIPSRRFGEGKISKIVVKPSKKELEFFYETKKLSITSIAKKIGVAEDTIKHWIIDVGLKYRAKGPRRKSIGITKENLFKLYCLEKCSTRQIAKKYNTSKIVIIYWLKKWNIPIRSSKTFNWEVRGINPPSKGQLEEDYKTLSLELIAKKYGFSTEPILTLLERYGIQKRNRGESNMLAIKMGRFPKTTTKPERLMKKLLQEAGLDQGLVEQYPLKFGKLFTRTDFAYPKYKVAIYCDGEYWHGGFCHINTSSQEMKDGPRKQKIQKTKEKDIVVHHTLWDNGWVSLHFWQHEIENNPKLIIEQIKKHLFDQGYINRG